MGDRTAEFFDELCRRGHEPLLRRVTGTVRFDLARGQQIEHWLLAIMAGDISVSREERDADCVVQTDQALFDRVVAGETKALAAMIRNDVRVTGKLQLFILLSRLLPAPSGAHHPRVAAGAGGRQA